jgi:crossover junction endodeoxyribonuclease RuvC
LIVPGSAVAVAVLSPGYRRGEELAVRRYTGEEMRVFGIDCGTEFTGYGVVEIDCDARRPKLQHLCAGAVKLSKRDSTPVRLAQIYAELMELLAAWQPEIVAIEEVFFAANAKSALKLGQVRGVALLAAANCGLPVAEYAPLSIKNAVTGYGLAAKEQVQFMVARLLELEQVPQPADAADALAVAICHIHHAQTAEALRR